MPTIKDKLDFKFGEIWASDFNLISVELGNNMFEEDFVASRDINETKINGNNKPLFHGIENSPLEFELSIAFEKGFNEASIDEIVRWLFVDYYRPLIFEGKDKVYKCLPTGDSKLVHNGLEQGYFTLTMRCDSSNIYSPTLTSLTKNIVGAGSVTLENDGHFDVYPEISILKRGLGTITIESLNDNGSIFEVRDLTDLENIYINCEKEIIQTDVLGVYRYDKLIGEFPRLLFGQNEMKITGDCDIQFRYKNIYKV